MIISYEGLNPLKDISRTYTRTQQEGYEGVIKIHESYSPHTCHLITYYICGFVFVHVRACEHRLSTWESTFQVKVAKLHFDKPKSQALI
jgi:hypothetical protein